MGFSQKWVEKAVCRLFGRDTVDESDLAKIKYLAIGESFDNDFFVEMSVWEPPKPFVNTDGGVRGSLWRDLALFTGIEVLRVQGLEIPDLTFLEKFTNLRAAEFVETVFASMDGIEGLNKLEQLFCWLD